MRRRDMIIIAVLINAGLLIVLFATALKTDPAQPSLATSDATPAKISELPLRKEVSATPVAATGDEVDQVLHQMSQPKQMPAIAASAPLVQNSAAPIATIAAVESKPNFADDLKAITGTESTISAPVIATPVSQVVAQAPEEKKVETAGFTEVKVKKGDVLEKIARTHHVSVDDIMKSNQLTSSRLKIGQVLRIPSKSGAKKSVAAKEDKKSDGAVRYYTVKNGDNPWTIAVKNHLKVEELLKLNQLDEEKARKLKPGDQLRIQ